MTTTRTNYFKARFPKFALMVFAGLAAGSIAIGTANAQDANRHFPGPRPAPSPMCLSSYRVTNTHVVDPRTIDFRMTDGRIYRNRLRTSCHSLRFYGFVHRTHGGDICANDTIRIVPTREVCMLGSFTLLPRPYHGR